MTYSVEFAVLQRGGTCSYAVVLSQGEGVVWQSAERFRNVPLSQVRELAARALEGVLRRHRIRAAVLRARLAPNLSALKNTSLTRSRDIPAHAERLAFLVLPQPPEFPMSSIERKSVHRAVAHGSEDYALDLLDLTCSCPSYRFRHQLCKHLKAAMKLA